MTDTPAETSAGGEAAAAAPAAPGAPVITSISFDKVPPAYYIPGTDTMRAAVTYIPGASVKQNVFSVTGTDQVSGLAGTLSAAFSRLISDAGQTKLDGTDDDGAEWALESDDGTGNAVFTLPA